MFAREPLVGGGSLKKLYHLYLPSVFYRCIDKRQSDLTRGTKEHTESISKEQPEEYSLEGHTVFSTLAHEGKKYAVQNSWEILRVRFPEPR